MQYYHIRWESLFAMCPTWAEREEFRKPTYCSTRARPRSEASLSFGVKTESGSSDSNGGHRTVRNQNKEEGRENRPAEERGPGSLRAGQRLCGELRAARSGTAHARGSGSSYLVL